MLGIYQLPFQHAILQLKIVRYKVTEYHTMGKSLYLCLTGLEKKLMVTGKGFELFESSMEGPRKSRKIPVEFSRPGYPDK